MSRILGRLAGAAGYFTDERRAIRGCMDAHLVIWISCKREWKAVGWVGGRKNAYVDRRSTACRSNILYSRHRSCMDLDEHVISTKSQEPCQPDLLYEHVCLMKGWGKKKVPPLPLSAMLTDAMVAKSDTMVVKRMVIYLSIS